MGLLGTLGGLAGSYVGGPVGGALGGALGGAMDGNETTNGGAGTTQKSPWGPSQQYLISNLKTNDDLQKFYQQNPFNAQQKASYDNIFGDLNTFRNQTAPGLMQFANNAMTGNYQRPSYSRPGMAGYGDRPSNQSPGAGLGNVFSVARREAQAPQQVTGGGGGGMMGGGLLGAIGGIASKFFNGANNASPYNGSSTYDPVDWNAMNPNSAQNALSAQASAQPAPKAAAPAASDIAAILAGLSRSGDSFGGYANGNGYNSGGGGMFGNVNDAFNSVQSAINTPAGAGATYAASLLGLLGFGKQNPENVPVTDLSTYGLMGGWSPSFGDTGTADSPGGSDMGGYGGNDNGY